MKYRKLRIAWSVTWGVVAVLLCVLWVRSYLAVHDELGIHNSIYLSDGGYIHSFEGPTLGDVLPARLPFVIPVVVAAGLTSLPWFPFRFSLRTLLIATTLVAVVLGLIVWLRSSLLADFN